MIRQDCNHDCVYVHLMDVISESIITLLTVHARATPTENSDLFIIMYNLTSFTTNTAYKSELLYIFISVRV